MRDLLDLIDDQQLKDCLVAVAQANNKVRGNGLALTIGVMGKSGAGKSSLINGLCQQNVCKSGAVGGCTRKVQHITAKIGKMNVFLVDFPGIAENQKWDQSYIELYKEHLDKLDIILWVIKIDDRAILEDEKFFKEYLSKPDIQQKCIFVLSQCDKAEPTREWDHINYKPSDNQLENINRNKYRIDHDFNVGLGNIIPVSNSYDSGIFKNYNLEPIFDAILFALADQEHIYGELSWFSIWDIIENRIDSCEYPRRNGWWWLW